MRPKIAVTVGDINGIGPEVALKAMIKKNIRSRCRPFLVSPVKVLNFYSKFLHLKFHVMGDASDFEDGEVINVLPMSDFKSFEISLGKPTKVSGMIAGESIKIAVNLCLEGKADAICTSPVSKKALNSAGFKFPGQTEMIAKLSNSKHYLMMFINEKIKVGLVTIHLPLKDVSRFITRELVREKIEILIDALSFDFRVSSPSIAVLGLNPHAGEEGLLGDEEEKILKPVINSFLKRNKIVKGPFPADGFFGEKKYLEYDAILAMYHDQGLIPVKLIDFYTTVNFSAGLKVVRTSPDHGTAYDIAGKFIANERSMEKAIILSAEIYTNRISNEK